jgi:hypothetical protein
MHEAPAAASNDASTQRSEFVTQLLPCIPAFDRQPATLVGPSSCSDSFRGWFHPVGLLGRGSFGEVLLVQYRPAPSYFFAAKSVDPNEKASMAEWDVASGIGTSPAPSRQADCEGQDYVLQYLCCVPAPRTTAGRRGVLSVVTHGQTEVSWQLMHYLVMELAT